MAVGFARLRHGSQLDPLIVLTVLTWIVYGVFLLLRYGADWRGRRAAYATLAGFALVVAMQLNRASGALRMSLVLVGTSHRLSPVEVRERVAFDLEESARARARGWPTAARRSACRPATAPSCTSLIRIPTWRRRLGADALLGEARSSSTGCATRRRLCTSSASRPGSTRSCRARARSWARCAPRTRRALAARCSTGSSAQALHVGKKVRTETAIGENPASVSSAAAALAQQVFGELEGCRVLLVGAGEVSELAARSLAARGASIAAVTSRTRERAERLAEAFGARAVPFDESATSSRRPTSSSRRRARPAVLSARPDAGPKGRPLFVIDLAVPRDVEPAVAELEDCYLYDIDDLAGRRQREPERKPAGGGARRVDRRARGERFRDWQASLDVVPAIASLRERAESIRSGELAKAEGRLDGLSESERRTVESLTTQIVNKLLHVPIVRMKEAAATEGAGYVEVARHLFGLGRGRGCCSESEAAEVGSR